MKLLGIDTLEIGIDINNYDNTFSNTILLLDKYKISSQEHFTKEQIELNDVSFFVCPKGQGMYKYKITNNYFSICFMSKQIKNTPAIYVRFSSLFLWEYGYKNAYGLFIEWFSNFNAIISKIKISRVDICFDCDEISFSDTDINSFFTKAKNIEKKFVDDVHYNSKVFSGYVISKGNCLSCRIYNKTLEIKKSSKLWFEDVWKEYCWNGLNTVWRTEFQIRGKALKELNILNINDIDNHLDTIWAYLTQKWLTMRTKSNDKNKTRWNIKRKWKVVQLAEYDYISTPQLRQKSIKGDREKIIQQCGGLLLTLSALNNDDSLSNSYLDVCNYLKNKAISDGSTISNVIHKRRLKLIGDH